MITKQTESGASFKFRLETGKVAYVTNHDCDDLLAAKVKSLLDHEVTEFKFNCWLFQSE